MKTNILLSIFLVCLLVAPMVSASIITTHSYQDADMKVEFRTLGLAKFGEATLTSHRNVNEVKEVPFGDWEVIMSYLTDFEDIQEEGLGDFEIINMKDGKEEVKEFKYVIKTNVSYQVPTYKEVCSPYAKGGNQTCSQVIDRYETRYRMEWVDYNSNVLPKGKAEIGIMVFVNEGDYYDGILTIVDERITLHAEWTASLNVGIQAYWNFDEPSGTLLEDEVAGINNGTITGSPVVTTGKLGNARNFTGTGTYIDVGGDASLDGDVSGSNLAIAGWFWVDSYSNYPNIFSSSTGATDSYVTALEAGTGRLGFCPQSGGCWFQSQNPVGLGAWKHLAYSVDNGNMSYYVNGAFDGSTATHSWGANPGTYRISYYGANAGFEGTIDELGIWNRSLSSAEITQLYNGGTGITYTADFVPVVTLNSPVDFFNATGQNITFNCSATDDGTVENISLIINGLINFTTSGGFLETEVTNIPTGIHTWNCNSTDNENNVGTGTSRNFTVDADVPNINIVIPATTTITDGLVTTNDRLIELNWTTVESNLDSCWYFNNSANVSVTCGANATFTLPYGTYEHIVYANDTFGNEGTDSQTANYTYKVLENSITFNTTTYETSPENFNINVTKGANITDLTANFWYNGTKYTPTETDATGSSSFSYSFGSVPLLGTENVGENRSIVWEILADSVSNNKTTTQLVNPINLTHCNSGETYINVSFKEEATLTAINGSIAASTWTHWLGDGTSSRQLVYSNTSLLNPNYGFCFLPAHETVNYNTSIQYEYTGYPQRTYKTSGTLTNTTTNLTLYSVPTADGLYVTFSLTDLLSGVVTGANVLVERNFAGTFTHIADGTTDDSGTSTFWLDPDYTHKLTFTKDGCTSKVYTVTPTLASYSVTSMDCSGVGSSTTTVNTQTYSSYIDGLTWIKYPANGIIEPGQTNFTFYLYSTKTNIEAIKFELVNQTGDILNSSTATTASGVCTLNSCSVNFSYSPDYTDSLRGRYYVDTTNTTGFVLIEGDAYWRFIQGTQNTTGTLTSFMTNFRYLFNEMGSNETCLYTTKGTCEANTNCLWEPEVVKADGISVGACYPNDERNKAEFSRIIFFFLLFVMAYAGLNRFTDIDSNNPGFIIWPLTFMVILGSMSNGWLGPGFFYYDGLFRGTSYAAKFFNNWILAGLMILISGGYFASRAKRES